MKNLTNSGKAYYTTVVPCKGCENPIRKIYNPNFTGYCRSCYNDYKKSKNRENIPKTKCCKICNIEQDINQFDLHRTGLPINNCYRCLKLKKYGITNKEYIEMSEKQNHCCAICNKPETTENIKGIISSLAVDHCHTTGKVRGLLCGNCNKGIGLFKDDISNLQKAIEYLT